MRHTLKTDSCYFQEVASGNKTFELRKNDRNFQPGDTLILQEYDGKQFTGREISCDVPYVFPGGQFGLSEDYCILSIVNEQTFGCFLERIGYTKIAENTYFKG